MKTTKSLLFISLIAFIMLSLIKCDSDSDTTEPPPPTVIEVITKSSSGSSFIANANVVLYNANSGEAISRAFTNNAGVCSFSNVSPGNYYVTITAQGYKQLPPLNITPVPFSVDPNTTKAVTYYLNIYPGTWGQIDGSVNPVVSNVLITSTLQTDGSIYSTYTGPDGYYVLFNLPFGNYELNALKAGYAAQTNPQTTISSGSSSATVNININAITGSTLSGSVTFLAVSNGIVDISILDRPTLSAVSGLSTMIDVNTNYQITSIPIGEYTAWATFQNDGYVMDPDWIFKNPGGLDIFFTSDTSKTLNFSVTGAITINSPTNPSNSIIPVLADSTIPNFQWTAYPQTKEYIIEVKDINGNIVWGGFENDGTIRHTQIPKESTSTFFNFDGSAVSSLISSEIYQWKIYADDDDAANIQTLISSSEDLMGLFIVP